LVSPSAVEIHKLLLRSQAIMEDAQDVPLSRYPLQPLDSFRRGLSRSSGLVGSGLCLNPFFIASERVPVGLGQLLRLRNQFLSFAQGTPGG
jgi:hypothetical protein